MATASFLPVRSFESPAWVMSYAIAHQLGRLFGTPHGNPNAMVFLKYLLLTATVFFSRLAELVVTSQAPRR